MSTQKSSISSPSVLFFWLAAFCCLPLPQAWAGYLDSSHGNSTYGAHRSSVASLGYCRANCAHCHEQHASIAGEEPDPVSGAASPSMLFAENHVSQTDNVCLKCHTGLLSKQSEGSLLNRSYSFRAGGWTSDPLDDIQEAFSSSGSVHHLDDIQTFLDGRWSYKSGSNPCVGCHNPHAAQGDPANSPTTAKSSSSRGWLISRPSGHGTSPWPLWGDGAGEKMSDYTSYYQAPYRLGSTTAFEPDGAATTDGSNLTDFNSFCLDCHDPLVAPTTITTSNTTDFPSGTLITIDWSQDKHGTAIADGSIEMNAPYNATLGKVLACTDCHEPHGSPNKYLIRQEVNGSTLAGTVGTGTKDLGYLCRQCHKDDEAAGCGPSWGNFWEYVHHVSADKPYYQFQCNNCHSGSTPGTSCNGKAVMNPIKCSNCHFHGAWVNDPTNPLDKTPNYAPTTRSTF